MEPLEKLYTVEDIANMTSLTTRTIRNYLKDGSLKGRKIGGQWRFNMEDIQKFMENGNVITTIAEDKKQSVLDFIDGVNTDVVGKFQICTIANIYEDEKAAICKREKICELVSTNTFNKPVKMDWTYSKEEQKARFILFACPEFIIEALKIINN